MAVVGIDPLLFEIGQLGLRVISGTFFQKFCRELHPHHPALCLDLDAAGRDEMGAPKEPAAFEPHEFDMMRSRIDPDTTEASHLLPLLIHHRYSDQSASIALGK